MGIVRTPSTGRGAHHQRSKQATGADDGRRGNDDRAERTAIRPERMTLEIRHALSRVCCRCEAVGTGGERIADVAESVSDAHLLRHRSHRTP